MIRKEEKILNRIGSDRKEMDKQGQAVGKKKKRKQGGKKKNAIRDGIFSFCWKTDFSCGTRTVAHSV